MKRPSEDSDAVLMGIESPEILAESLKEWVMCLHKPPQEGDQTSPP